MMISWFDRHRRLRDQLSAYIDGELDAPSVQLLEKHLAACERCRGELEQLRATAAALRELPQVDVPRSFVLSSERAAAPPPAHAPPSPLSFAPRILAAGLAVALAAVLVVDLGDLGGGGNEPTAPMTTIQADADVTTPPEAGAAADETFEVSPAEPAAGGVAPEERGEADLDTGAVGETPSAEGEAGSRTNQLSGEDAAETPAGGPQEVEPTSAPAGGDGGIDPLTAAEIALAAALAASVAGSLVLAYAGRKR